MKVSLKLHTQIVLGIIFGVFVGVVLREHAVVFQPLGDIFIRLLKMIIIPIVFASLVVGILNLGSIQGLSRLGTRTFFYYITTTFIAVLIGLIVVNVMKPGFDSNLDLTAAFAPNAVTSEVVSISDILVQVVPKNIIVSMVQEEMLGVIFFSLVFGCALLVVGRKGAGIVSFVEGLNDVVLKITEWIMLIAPVGVFALMASIVGKTGLTAFKPLALYMSTVLIALGIHVLFVHGSILLLLVRYSPIHFVRQLFPALATAFSTDSSVATLPVTMECLEKNVGVSQKVVGFVTPLGATMNMDGTALYEAVAVMFIAQLYGVDMTLLQQLTIALTATLASIGAAGIPSAGLVTMVIVLKAVNLPLEAIGLLLAVDRILDMCRTTVNVFGDCCGSLVIARLEGERLIPS